MHKLVPVKVGANFDESPVAYNGEFTKHVVIKDTETDLSFESRGSEDSKRMFTCALLNLNRWFAIFPAGTYPVWPSQ